MTTPIKGKIVCNEDGQGNSNKMYKREGRLFPTFGHTAEECDKLFDDIQHFKARPDDIWICAFEKSGTHWLWEVVIMLLTNSTELHPHPKEYYMLEDSDTERLESLPSPRVLNAHFELDILPPGIWKTRNKVIHPVRNIKDIVVSLYHHVSKSGRYKGSFEAFVKLRDESIQTWYRYEHEWRTKHRDNPDVLFLKYEEMLKDPVAMVKEVARFLDIAVSDERVNFVVEKTSLQNMKANKIERGANDRVVQGIFYRKGQAGDWKNHFTVAFNEEFDKKHAERMKDVDIDFVFEC